MKNTRTNAIAFQYFLQGMLLVMSPLVLLGVNAVNPLTGTFFTTAAACAATLLITAGTGIILNYRKYGRILCTAGILLNIFLLSFELTANPMLMLLCMLPILGALYYLITMRLYRAQKTTSALQLERLLGCSCGVFVITVISPLFAGEFDLFSKITAISMMLLLLTAFGYLRLKHYYFHKIPIYLAMAAATVLFAFAALKFDIILGAFFTAVISLAVTLKLKHSRLEYLELIMNHPARCLGITFLGLCIAGTLLLIIPDSSNGNLTVIDAAFTAVSAACVTGLIPIDISNLTLIGKVFLLLTIQLGGLGIMSLAALILHFLGRFTLNGEQIISALTPVQENDIFSNLALIVRFTFIVETVGAVLLSWGFYTVHKDILYALELGIFTSVSAFCNAGFFPESGNLAPYAGEKMLLIIIALEIIIGGIAPAMTCSLLRKQSLRRQPFIIKLVFGTTALLLLTGMGLLLLFEWDGLFAELSWQDKVVNSFFLSASLRTAGFSTVNPGAAGISAYLIMLTFMFTGGSPGGTAGGIKTTTLAVLVLTFRSALNNSDSVIADQHRIAARTIVQAVAIFLAAAMVLTAEFMLLATTQDIALKKLFFESVSALATVGLSLDTTANLDSIGKVVVMAAMFAGRIGPLTLFLLLSERHSEKLPGYPEITIPLG